MKKLVLSLCLSLLSLQALASEDVRSLIAYMRVRPGTESQFLAAAQNVIALSRRERGNLMYVLQQSVENPQQFVFYELFKSDADLEYHRRSPHVVQFLNQVKPIVVPGQFILQKYNNVR